MEEHNIAICFLFPFFAFFPAKNAVALKNSAEK